MGRSGSGDEEGEGEGEEVKLIIYNQDSSYMYKLINYSRAFLAVCTCHKLDIQSHSMKLQEQGQH